MKISQTGFWHDEKKLYHTCCIALCDWISNYIKDQKEKQIYDLGCGLGQYCDRLSKDGFTNILGVEGSQHAHNVFANIKVHDLTTPLQLDVKGNVIFLEVAEHIPAQFEDILLTNVANACDENLIMSWALPKQGGDGHVNEITNEQAIERVSKKGFIYLPNETADARSKILNGDPCPWFRNTTLIFKKG